MGGYNTIDNRPVSKPDPEEGEGGHCVCPSSSTCLFRVACFCFFVTDMLLGPLLLETMLQKQTEHANVSTTFYEHTQGDEVRNLCLNSSGSPGYDDVHATEKVESIITTMDIIQLVPSCMGVLILGAWSDRTRKRTPLLWIPALGNVIFAFIIVINFYLKQDGSYLMYIGAFISGICGRQYTFMVGSSSYNVDIVPVSRRSHEFAILETMSAISIALSNMIFAYVVDHNNLESPIWIVLILSVISGCLVYIIKEPTETSPKTLNQEVTLRSLFGSYSFLRFSMRTVIILMYLAIFGTYLFVLMGLDITTPNYLRQFPTCLTSLMISWYEFLEGALMAFGTFVLTRIQMSWTTCLEDAGFLSLGLASRLAASFYLTLAEGLTAIFISPLFMMLQLLPLPALRAMASKVAQPHEYASVFACMACVRALCSLTGQYTFVTVLIKTFENAPSSIFYLSIGLLILPIFLSPIARWMTTRYFEKNNYTPLNNLNLEKPPEPHTSDSGKTSSSLVSLL